MFAPEGYVNWDEIVGFFSEWSDRILLAHYLKDNGEDPDKAFSRDSDATNSLTMYRLEKELRDAVVQSDETADQKTGDLLRSMKEQELQIALICTTLLSKALQEFDTLLYSPDGKIMLSPVSALLHMDRLDWCYWDWPLRKTPEFQSFYKFFDAGEFVGEDLFSRFCFIDSHSGTITIKNNSQRQDFKFQRGR